MTLNYTYDANGNVTNDGAHTYGYDSENRTASVDGGSTASYAYDHQNRRYKKTVGSTVTHYVWQGLQVLAEHNGGTGASLGDYVYSGNRMIAKASGLSTQYFLSDRLSTRLTLDGSGNVLGRQGHLPFGEDFGESGAQEKHHFTTYEQDTESGLHYALNRSYSALVIKFTSVDPSKTSASGAEPQSWNRYNYTGNDPINKTDETGLDDINVQQAFGEDPGEDTDSEEILATAPSAAVCNAILPSDEDGQLAVSVVLGEATPLERINQPTYRTDDRFGSPTGSGTVDDQTFFDEAIAMVSVIANRANDRHKPWRKIITQSQFHGLKRGKKLLKQYQEYFPGTLQCNELNRAADAVFVMRVGAPVYTFRYWVAIFNPG